MITWLLLGLTIILEVAGTISMKLSNGFTRVVPSILLFVFYGSCFTLFTFVITKMDMSIAYAIWSGLGTLSIFIIAVIIFGESISITKGIFVLLIVVGVAGLKFMD